MKKIKLNTERLQFTKEKVANLTVDEMHQLQGGQASGISPCLSISPCQTDLPCTAVTCSHTCTATTCPSQDNRCQPETELGCSPLLC